ncbi:hypothetical protein ACAG24_026255 [Mycobacterium sp. pW049]|uniref:hypothetical protein n=1 Tax=[Mycobacterium] bulgaricum TaxID=3238985 RepID=UPI00351BB14C
MTHHPSRPHDDDPTEADALARVNRIRAARGLPPIVERNPQMVRRDLIDDRDAAMIAVAVLRREGAGFNVPDAIDTATAGFGPEVFDAMPHAVAVAIRDRLPAEHRPAVIDALDEVLERFEAGPGGWAHAQLCVHRIADTVRGALTASIAAEGSGAIDHITGLPVSEPADQLAAAADFAAGIVYADLIAALRDYLAAMAGLPAAVEVDDTAHETRCLRASVMNALAQMRGDSDMQDEAVRLALIVCHDRPGMKISDVFRAGTPLLLLPADATRADIEAALVAELAAIADTDDGGAP